MGYRSGRHPQNPGFEPQPALGLDLPEAGLTVKTFNDEYVKFLELA